MKPHYPLALASVILLASCGAGTDKKDASSSSEQKFVPFSQRIGSGGGSPDPNSFKKGANGKLGYDNAKRSQYENQGQATIGGKQYQKKDYRTGDYAKKSWWGNKDYDSKTYAGPTDGSRFQTSSRLDGQGAPESGSQARVPDPYNTGKYATGDAREAGNVNRDNAIQAREEGRNNDQFQWHKERDLSVDQSRSLLGH